MEGIMYAKRCSHNLGKPNYHAHNFTRINYASRQYSRKQLPENYINIKL